jgi:hypothetical protein
MKNSEKMNIQKQYFGSPTGVEVITNVRPPRQPSQVEPQASQGSQKSSRWRQWDEAR